jgi:PST family polysaccharide transporter
MLERPLLWSLAQQGGRQTVNYVMFLVLAIVLSPLDFGIVAIAATWLALIQVWSEIGLSAALIQRPNVQPGHLSSTFFANVALGVTLTAIGMLSAAPVAAFFRAPNTAPIIAALSINLLINSLGLTHVALAQRELRFRQLAIRDIVAALVGGVTGIVLAVSGYGAWSLVAQSLVTSAVGLTVMWKVTPWHPRWSEWSLQSLRELWGYSSKILSFNIFKYFAQNTDKLLVGYLLGPLALGLYNVAFRFVLAPVSAMTGAVGSYLFPRIARAQASVQDVARIYLSTQRLTNSVVAPVVLAVAVAGPVLVPAVLGQRWAAAAPLVQVFAFVALAQVWISLVGQLLKSLDRPGWLFNWSVAFTALIYVCLWIGSRWGLLGVGLGMAAAHGIGLVINYVIVRRLLPVRVADFAAAAWGAGVAAVAFGVWLWASLQLSLHPTARLVIGLVAGLLVYAAVLWNVDKRFLADSWSGLVGDERARQVPAK